VTSALSASGTNAQNGQELRGDQLDWPGRSATNAGNIRVSAALGAQLTGILTDAQYRTVLKALGQRSGADILAAPRVTTLSGRQAQVQIVDLQTVMTAINPAALVQPGTAPGTNTVPYLTSSIPVGPTLDVIPNVGADGSTIHLTVIPTVTEFLGYDHPGEDGKVRVWQDGQAKSVALPLPRFRVRQMQTQAQVRDGQTLVLGGFPVEARRLTKDKVPVLGDLPAVGGLFRSEAKQTVKKQLVVFVTATIVDPAGNPVHR
jgi:general secretion pathway protein D